MTDRHDTEQVNRLTLHYSADEYFRLMLPMAVKLEADTPHFSAPPTWLYELMGTEVRGFLLLGERLTAKAVGDRLVVLGNELRRLDNRAPLEQTSKVACAVFSLAGRAFLSSPQPFYGEEGTRGDEKPNRAVLFPTRMTGANCKSQPFRV